VRKSKRYSFVFRKTNAHWRDSTNELSPPPCAESLEDLILAAQTPTRRFNYQIAANKSHRLHGLRADFETDPHDAFAFHSLHTEGAARVDYLVANV
jgi:hypothetical protein